MRDLISESKQICRMSQLYGPSPLLYFNLKSSMDPNTSSFIRFQSFVHESGILFSGSRNFCKLKSGDLISKGNQFWGMSELFGPPTVLYFDLKSSMDPNSALFSSFQSFLYESGVLFLESWNFYKLKSWYLISGWNQFCRMLHYLVPTSLFQFQKFSRPKFFVIH